jgi:2-(1,2-epoxy-1,2-dihydrophenyl)acetyl-CoA isomerase
MMIEFSVEAGVATLRLNRPEKKNAILLAMRDELAALCERIDDDPEIRAVVLCAAGSDFCAGADVGEFGQGGINGSFYRAQHMHKLMRAIARVRRPVVCAVRGVAVGIGFSLALAADVVLASPTARFSQIQKKIALPPDGGGVWFLTRHLSIARAKDLVFSARWVSADEAHQLGFVLRVVPDAELEAEAQKLAREYAEGPTIALGIAKRMFDVAHKLTLDEFMEIEGTAVPLSVQVEDFREGAASFREKRPPKFTGR